jgi:hypothetical protein
MAKESQLISNENVIESIENMKVIMKQYEMASWRLAKKANENTMA